MEFRFMRRSEDQLDLVAVPSHPEGIFTGIVKNDSEDDLIDWVGRRVLLSGLPAEIVQAASEGDNSALEQFLVPHPEREGVVLLKKGVEGTMYQAIGRDGELVDAKPLVISNFSEYAPYPPSRSTVVRQGFDALG